MVVARPNLGAGTVTYPIHAVLAGSAAWLAILNIAGVLDGIGWALCALALSCLALGTALWWASR
jgi:hypothetical protein